MRFVFVFICSVLIFNICLPAQNGKLVTVKAGTKVLDYFPVQERYRYPEFVPGQVFFKNGVVNSARFNYNILFGEIEFIQSRDTLSIVKKKDIRLITVAQDTFIYDNCYLEVISGGQVKVGLKQYVQLKDVLKKGAFGTTARSVSIDSYKSMNAGGVSYDLIPDEEIVLQKTREYYLATISGGFVQFSKKNAIQLFPQRADNIKSYLKSNKIKFDSRDDLLRFADYLRNP
jgi:hypothetical protein